jgi:hypothetical protein
MYELDPYRYPYLSSFYPSTFICLGLTLMVGGITVSAAYQTMDHLTIIFVYSIISLMVGIGTHLEAYNPHDEL